MNSIIFEGPLPNSRYQESLSQDDRVVRPQWNRIRWSLSLFSLASTEGLGQEIRAVERLALPPTSRSTAREREREQSQTFFFSLSVYIIVIFFFFSLHETKGKESALGRVKAFFQLCKPLRLSVSACRGRKAISFGAASLYKPPKPPSPHPSSSLSHTSSPNLNRDEECLAVPPLASDLQPPPFSQNPSKWGNQWAVIKIGKALASDEEVMG